MIPKRSHEGTFEQIHAREMAVVKTSGVGAVREGAGGAAGGGARGRGS